MRIKIKLYSKVDNYSAVLDFPTYMMNIWHEGIGSDASDVNHFNSAVPENFRLTGSGQSYTEYVYTIPKSTIEANSALDTSLEIPIYYSVYTGAVFEAKNLVYSNYKLVLDVELTKSEDRTDILLVSKANDFIIYTNARVIPDYIDR